MVLGVGVWQTMETGAIDRTETERVSVGSDGLFFGFLFGGRDRPDCCWEEEGNWRNISQQEFISKFNGSRSMKRSVAGGAVYIGDGRGKGEGRREVVITSEAREQGGARHVGDGRRGLVWSPDSPGGQSRTTGIGRAG